MDDLSRSYLGWKPGLFGFPLGVVVLAELTSETSLAFGASLSVAVTASVVYLFGDHVNGAR